VRRAALLVAAEGAALVVLGLVYGVVGALGRPEDRLATELAAALAVLTGAGLALLARALGRLRGWARTPVALLNLLALPVGYGLAQGRLWLSAVLVLAPALGVLLLLAAPTSRLAFRGLD